MYDASMLFHTIRLLDGYHALYYIYDCNKADSLSSATTLFYSRIDFNHSLFTFNASACVQLQQHYFQTLSYHLSMCPLSLLNNRRGSLDVLSQDVALEHVRQPHLDLVRKEF